MWQLLDSRFKQLAQLSLHCCCSLILSWCALINVSAQSLPLKKSLPTNQLIIAAFEASERARARSLIELIAEGDIRQSIDEKLLAQEEQLRQQFNRLATQLVKLKSIGGKPSEQQALEQHLRQIGIDLENIQVEIRRVNPRAANLTSPPPLTLSEIQQLLDNETILLEYAIGNNQSFLWLVTTTTITSYQLPKRSELAAVSQQLQQLLINQSLEFYRVAQQLSEMILLPAAQQLGSKRLIIVADGPLQSLPFAALPLPLGAVGSKKSREYQPLILEHEIINLPAASLLIGLRKRAQQRTGAGKTIAVLADPVFSNSDQRLKQPSAESPDNSLTRSYQQELTRLPGTRLEAEAIRQLVGEKDRQIALDFDANLSSVFDASLRQYRILHFATPSYIDSDNGALTSLIFSLVNSKGEEQRGMLFAPEIAYLKLPVELIVLSASKTNLGKEIKGEGNISLARQFIQAGATRVIGSLYQVNDRATAELMSRFYQKMLGKDRMTATAALRAAQISMWQDQQWQHPYYWAGFLLQGDWR